MNAHPDAPRPSLAELTSEIEAAIREAGYQGAVTRDPEKGLIGIEGGGSVSYEHIYEQLAGHPRERRREALAGAARMLVRPLELPATWAEAVTRVRLTLKPQISLVCEALRRGAGQGPAETWVSKLTEHLSLELAVPCEGGMLNVPRATLSQWGVTPDEAFNASVGNDAPTFGTPWRMSPDYPGVLRSPWNDARDGARLVAPGLFARLPLQGRPVAMLPTPGMLLVTGSDDAKGLVHMARLAKKTLDDHGMSFVLRAVRLGEDGAAWEDWLPPRGHPAYEGLRLLEAMQERRDFNEHAELSVEVARAKGEEPVTYPRLEVLQDALTGLVMTVTTWRSGRPVALPKADAVVLRQGARTLGLVSFDELRQALPGELGPLPGYPVRYLAATFPEEWQLGGLTLRPWRPPPEPGS